MRKEVKKNSGKGQNEEQRKREKGESKTEGTKVVGGDRKKIEQKYLCNIDQM